MKSQFTPGSISVFIVAICLASATIAQRPRIQQADAATSQDAPSPNTMKKRADSTAKQFIEVRTYALVDNAAQEQLDSYLRDALIPALQRQGALPGALVEMKLR